MSDIKILTGTRFHLFRIVNTGTVVISADCEIKSRCGTLFVKLNDVNHFSAKIYEYASCYCDEPFVLKRLKTLINRLRYAIMSLNFNGVRTLELTKIARSDADFQRAYDLYESTFPSVERRDYADHLKAMERHNFFVNAIVEDGEFVGIMQFWEATDFIYLEHFAILDNLRGKQLGQKALNCLKSLNKTVILEIEPPESSQTALRRLRFYQREGFLFHPVKHVQAHYHQDDDDFILNVMATKPLSNEDYEKFRLFIDNEIIQYKPRLKN